MKKINKMTWIKIIIMVIVIGTMVLCICMWSVTLDPPEKVKPVFKTETSKVVSEKEIWLKSLERDLVDLVKSIDSLPIDSVLSNIRVESDSYWERIPDVTKTPDGIWEEVQPADYSWSENVYNEESGEPLKTNTFKSHVGNVYIRSILKEDLWEVIYGNEGGFSIEKYVLQYGILLKADTIDKKIYPSGTYVVSKYFVSESEFNRNHKEFEYFADYEKFIDNLFERIGLSKNFFGDLLVCKPRDIDVIF